MSSEPRLDGVALVTGAGSGIGRAVALRFAEAGAKVVVADIDADSANETAAAIVAAGGTAHAQRADVSDDEQVGELVAVTVETFGGLHYAANIAGFGPPPVPLLDTPAEVLDTAVAVNVKGTWSCIVHEARQMSTNGGGSIINTGSGVGLRARPGTAAYGASKAAIMHLTRVAAVELAPAGVRVNAISPGPTSTPGFNSLAEDVDAWHRDVLRHVPVGRLGQPSDTAAAALWLASDEASFVTGVVLPVDGGEGA